MSVTPEEMTSRSFLVWRRLPQKDLPQSYSPDSDVHTPLQRVWSWLPQNKASSPLPTRNILEKRKRLSLSLLFRHSFYPIGCPAHGVAGSCGTGTILNRRSGLICLISNALHEGASIMAVFPMANAYILLSSVSFHVYIGSTGSANFR